MSMEFPLPEGAPVYMCQDLRKVVADEYSGMATFLSFCRANAKESETPEDQLAEVVDNVLDASNSPQLLGFCAVTCSLSMSSSSLEEVGPDQVPAESERSRFLALVVETRVSNKASFGRKLL
jgi:hypothetical protein